MPNIRRTFPGSSRNNEDDEEDDYVPVYRGGGKQLAGGKGFRPDQADDEDDDDDSDDSDESDSEEEAPQQHYVVNRGSGKQLGGGKYLRPSHDDVEDEDVDSDEDEDDDEPEPPQEAQPIRVMPRGGGKNFIRPVTHEESEDDSEEEDDDDEEEEETPTQTYTVVGRGGGKSLKPIAAESEESEKSEESEEDEEEEGKEKNSNQIRSAYHHGKQMRRPELEEEKEATAPTISHHGGKQLRRPPEPEDEQEALAPTIRQYGSKQLRPPEPEKEITKSAPPQPIRTSGKQLSRIPQADSEEDDEDDDDEDNEEDSKPPTQSEPEKIEPEVAPEPVKTTGSKPPGSGKQLNRGGKQLRRAVKDDDDEDDEDDEDEEEASFESEDDDDDEYEETETKNKAKRKSKDDDDYEESKPARKTKAKPKEKTKPKPKAAPKTKEKKAPEKKESVKREASKKKVEEHEEIFGDDDVSSDDEAELDMNNAEGLIKDEADRKYLDSLPELEREAILAERFEKLKAEQDMKIAMREAKRKEVEAKGKSKDEKAKETPYTGADEEIARNLAGRRSSVRERDATGVKSKKQIALAALKKERKIQQDVEESSGDSEMDFGDEGEDSDEDYDEGEAKPWQKKTKLSTAGKTSVSRLDQSDESGEDMDIDEDDDKPQSKLISKGKETSDTGKSALEADHEDFMKVTIPRRRLERWCNEPFFQAAVLECYVRVLIGEDESGEKVYRLCEIVDVKTTNKTFKFPVADKNKNPVSTNKLLRLKFGNSERDFPMYLVSDAPPTELDIQKYVTAQKNNRLEILSKRRAAKLRRLQDELVNNYTYTTEDIEKNLQRQKKSGKTMANLGLETTKISIAVKGAKEAVAEAEQKLAEAKKTLMESNSNPAEESELENRVHDCTDALKEAKKKLQEKLEEEKVILAAVQDRKRKLAQREKDLNWAKVNERALQTNQQADREGYKAQKEAELSKFPGKKDEFNPYARRRVKPKVLWKVGTGPVEEDETKGEEKKEAKEEAAVKIEQSMVDDQAPSLVQETHKAVALSESHQFAIDEEGLVQSSTLASLGLGGKMRTQKRQRARKGLSLAQYLELKEQGAL